MSEETEVRKEEIINGLRTLRGELANNYKDNQRIGFIAGVNRAIEFIHSTDEPEVLSQEWIDENKSLINGRSTNPDGTEGDCYDAHYIHVLELQNLLVPKQEKVKIESVWAEDIKDAKASGMTLFEAMDWMAIDCDEKEKQDLFARAWLDGFTVEEEREQKYYVLDEGNIPFLAISNGEVNREPMHMTIYAKGRDNAQFALTEKEIKDYDPRYWAFRKPVEEL